MWLQRSLQRKFKPYTRACEQDAQLRELQIQVLEEQAKYEAQYAILETQARKASETNATIRRLETGMQTLRQEKERADAKAAGRQERDWSLSRRDAWKVRALKRKEAKIASLEKENGDEMRLFQKTVVKIYSLKKQVQVAENLFDKHHAKLDRVRTQHTAELEKMSSLKGAKTTLEVELLAE